MKNGFLGSLAVPAAGDGSSLKTRAIDALRKTRNGAQAQLRGLRAAFGESRRAARGAVMARLGAFALAHPARASALARRAAGLLGGSSLLRDAQALTTARAHGWAAAAEAAARAASGPAGAGAALLAPPSPTPPARLAVPAAARPAFLSDADAARVVVYTARFGDAPDPPPLFGLCDRIRFLCVTDRPDRDVRGWRAVSAPADPLATARCKILAAETLAEAAPDAETSLWLDPERLLAGNLDTFLTRWAAGADFALWRRADASDWSDLAERHLVYRAAPVETIVAQAAACAAEGVPRRAGCFDTGVLWRRHGAPEIAALMTRWWTAEREAPGADALSLLRALGTAPAAGAARPAIMPLALGPAEKSVFFARLRRAPVAAPRAKALAAPGVARGRIPLTFVYSTHRPNSTTTLLRGKQLSELIAARYGDLYDVRYTHEMDAVRDQVVIVTKEALWLSKPSRLRKLKARNVAMIGSWEDGRPEPEKMALLDAVMTLSMRSMLDLNRLWPKVPAFHVTHNVNTAVPSLTPPTDRLRTGYFGDLGNTVRPDSLAEVVELVNADPIGLKAKGISNDWIDALPQYNCHWIVRNPRPFDGWKPFLKGFVAARCGATVIVTRDDENALHYLGDDYPFYAESLSAADLETAWTTAAAAFGGPDWRFAQDIMRQVAARSSDAQVAAEFKAMIDAVVG